MSRQDIQINHIVNAITDDVLKKLADSASNNVLGDKYIKKIPEEYMYYAAAMAFTYHMIVNNVNEETSRFAKSIDNEDVMTLHSTGVLPSLCRYYSLTKITRIELTGIHSDKDHILTAYKKYNKKATQEFYRMIPENVKILMHSTDTLKQNMLYWQLKYLDNLSVKKELFAAEEPYETKYLGSPDIIKYAVYLWLLNECIALEEKNNSLVINEVKPFTQLYNEMFDIADYKHTIENLTVANGKLVEENSRLKGETTRLESENAKLGTSIAALLKYVSAMRDRDKCTMYSGAASSYHHVVYEGDKVNTVAAVGGNGNGSVKGNVSGTVDKGNVSGKGNASVKGNGSVKGTVKGNASGTVDKGTVKGSASGKGNVSGKGSVKGGGNASGNGSVMSKQSGSSVSSSQRTSNTSGSSVSQSGSSSNTSGSSSNTSVSQSTVQPSQRTSSSHNTSSSSHNTSGSSGSSSKQSSVSSSTVYSALQPSTLYLSV